MKNIAVKVENIIKDFPGVRALNNVSLEVKYGEVLILAGENGAGKSTLIKVISGDYDSYFGKVYIDNILRTKESKTKKIAVIRQELNLVEELSVAENIFLGRLLKNRFGLIDWEKIYYEAKELLKKLNVENINVKEKIKNLSISQRQIIAIAKALSKKTDIIIFDEPTSALSENEIKILFKIINDLKSKGVAIIYISHKIDEYSYIGDKIAILRDGSLIGEIQKIKDITLDEIITKMVGRDISDMYPKERVDIGEKIFEVRNISLKHPKYNDRYVVKDVSFQLKKGEILGIAGLMGAGRTQLMLSIFGAYEGEREGEIILEKKGLDIKSPKDAIEHGIVMVTEDRMKKGLFLENDINFNVITVDKLLREISNKIGVLNFDRGKKLIRKYIDEIKVKVESLNIPIKNLSGGNQQKIILSKWLATNPKIIILDEPTKGMDVGAKVEIYKIINKLLKEGMSIILISSELPELLGLSDRILVMNEGEIVTEFSRENATQKKIMAFATGNFKRGEIDE
jgi:ABC-type sugar transport system ATPase subunit